MPLLEGLLLIEQIAVRGTENLKRRVFSKTYNFIEAGCEPSQDVCGKTMVHFVVHSFQNNI